jgi:hypothetical protein
MRERLELALADGEIHSLRNTPGRSELVKLAAPDAELERYRLTLAMTAKREDPPDEQFRQRIRELTRPLQAALQQAIPAETRERMAAKGPGSVRRLISIELTLNSVALEKYPWELIADPETLCGNAADVTVWRRVPPSPERPLRRWTTRVLLTGSAAMRRTPPFVREELEWIAGELAPLDLDPVQLADIQPDLERLLTKHRPGAFHLVAHGTSRGITFQAQAGPTPDELQIAPAFLGRALEESGVWVASFNCCDSATPASSQVRPVACQIAARSGAAAIGMAALIPPYPGALFARTFYHGLGCGRSVLEAYHLGVRAVRADPIYSTMWSIPVMYANEAEVIPFPVSDEARIRLGLGQIRDHLIALGAEFENLASWGSGSPGEWSNRAARSRVRLDCIESYASEVAAACARRLRHEHGRRHIEFPQRELGSFVRGTADWLARLTESALGPAVLSKVPRQQRQREFLLETMEELLEELGKDVWRDAKP